eukprot:c11093_g1_i1 orf=535-750(-)
MALGTFISSLLSALSDWREAPGIFVEVSPSSPSSDLSLLNSPFVFPYHVAHSLLFTLLLILLTRRFLSSSS